MKNIEAIWSNGTNIWVIDADPGPDVIRIYNLSTGRDLGGALTISNTVDPGGIWASSNTLYLGDTDTNRITASRLGRSPGTLGISFNVDISPYGIWSDGTTMWVYDRSRIRAYVLATGFRDISKEFTLSFADGLGGNPGFTADSNYFYVGVRNNDFSEFYVDRYARVATPRWIPIS